MTIYLIGTAHKDTEGPSRLEHVLLSLQPDTVFVEGSNEFRNEARQLLDEYAPKLTELLKSKGCKDDTIQALKQAFLNTTFYEIETCEKYCSNERKKLVYLETPELSKKTLQELRTQADFILFALSQAPSSELERLPAAMERSQNKNYDLVNRALKGNASPEECDNALRFVRGQIIGKRDEEYALRIRNEASEKNAIIIGAFHLLDDPQGQTLYERLKDLKPLRLTLNGAEKHN